MHGRLTDDQRALIDANLARFGSYVGKQLAKKDVNMSFAYLAVLTALICLFWAAY